MKKKLRKLLTRHKWSKLISLLGLLLFFALPAFGQLTTNMSEEKHVIGSTSLGTKAYFGGGEFCDASSCTSKVEIYDAATGAWDDSHDLSVARSVCASVTSGTKVFFAGGADFTGFGLTVFSEVDILETTTGDWIVEHLSVPRITSAVSKDSIVIFAGGLPASNVVDIYNTITGNWTTATLSEARDARAAVVVGDLAIFAGGFNGQTVSKRVDIYHFSTGEWSIDSLSVPRGFLTATVVDNKAYFAGGMTNDNQVSKIVDIYDPSDGGHWSTDSLSAPRAFVGRSQAATLGGKAYFVNGGRFDLGTGQVSWVTGSDKIDVYDPEEGWSSFTNLGQRVNHTVVTVENDSISQLFIAGGIPCSTDVDIISKTEPVDFQDQKVDYTIFPNPAKEELNINVSFKNKTNGTLSLFDVQGHTAYQYEFNEGIIDHKIDLNAFAPGLYLVEIRTESGKIVEKVVIVE